MLRKQKKWADLYTLTTMILNEEVQTFVAVQDCNQAGEYIRYQWQDANDKEKNQMQEYIGRNPITDEKVNLVDTKDQAIYHFQSIPFQASITRKYVLEFHRTGEV